MPVEINVAGYIEVWRDGALVSRHNVESNAIEAVIAHTELVGDGDYELRYPKKVVMSRLRKQVVPFRWNTINAAFTQGTAATVNLAAFLANAQGRVIVYSVIGTLPTGVTLTGSTLSYNGTAAASSASAQFRATSGIYVADSASTLIAIAAAPVGNTEPTWAVNTPATLGPFTAGAGGVVPLSQWAYDAEGDPIRYYRTGDSSDTAPGSVTVDPNTGVLTVPPELPAANYSIVVGVAEAISAAEQDWIDRSNGAGVVWAHNFDTASEVNQFRWAGGFGNDPGDLARPGLMVWDSTDRTSGAGCMKVTNPAGDREAPLWWRMFSPIRSPGNGRPSNDRGNGIALKTFSPSSGGSQTTSWVGGFYGPPSYVAADPTYYDGTSFYLQMRVKIDPQCTNAQYVRGGKIFWFCHTSGTSNGSQIVTISKASGYDGGPNYHNMYGLGQDGYGSIGYDSYSGQLGSDLGPPYCNYGPYSYGDAPPYNTAPCWAYSGGWDTLLYQIVPGEWGQNTTILRVWAAHEGIKTYTKIWDLTIAKSWDSPPPSLVRMGHNAIALSHYVNKFESNYSTTISSYHKFAEVIFSHNFIECPQA